MIPIISIVVAIGIPAFAIWKNGKKPLKRPYLFSVISFTFCTIAAIMELFTIGAVIATCIGLLVFTVILNLLLLGISYEKDS